MFNVLMALDIQPTYKTVRDEIILKIAEGDAQAFQDLYDACHTSVYGFALSLTKNTYDAEDVLHDTFVTVWEKSGSYLPLGKPMAWILRIAKNNALMKLRKQSNTDSFDELELSNSLSFSHIDNLDEKLALKTLIETLDSQEQQIVLLKAVDGLKAREIAELLEIPLNTVLSKYHRAVKKLKNEFEKGEN